MAPLLDRENVSTYYVQIQSSSLQFIPFKALPVVSLPVQTELF